MRYDRLGRPVFVIQRMVTGHRFCISTRAHTLDAALVHLKRFESDPDGYAPRRKKSTPEPYSVKHKRDLRRRGVPIECVVCGWRVQAPFDAPDAVNAHHVLPTKDGGSDSPANMLLLCPNHHAIAHALYSFRRGNGGSPHTRDELVAILKALHDDPGYLARDIARGEAA